MSRGRAVLTITATGGTRTYTLQEDGDTSLERAPGDLVTFTLTTTTTGLTPPGDGVVDVVVKDGDGGAITTRALDVTVPASGSYRFVQGGFSATAQAMAGTLELDLRATLGGVNGYDVSTDNRGTQTLSAGLTATRERHWQRANTGITIRTGLGTTIANTPVVSYGDDWQVDGTFDVPVFALRVTFTARSTGGSTLRSRQLIYPTATGSNYGPLMNPVGSPLPVDRVAVVVDTSITTHPASGVANIVLTQSVLAQSPDLDARITVLPHMQHNDNAFGTPPSSKNAGSQRLTSDLSFIAARLVNARSEGLNGISLTRHLYDAGQLVGTPTAGVKSRTDTTVTVNGEAGWTPIFITWDNALPGGLWHVRNTASGAATGMLTPLDSDRTLIAADPNLVCITGAGPATAQTEGRHFIPGEPLVIGMAVLHVGRDELVEIDVGSARVMVARFNVALGRAEILQADAVTWLPAQDAGAVVYHSLSESFPGSKVYVRTLTGTTTASWSTADIFTVGRATVGGVPITNYLKEISVNGVNNHTSYSFDPLSPAGFGSR